MLVKFKNYIYIKSVKFSLFLSKVLLKYYTLVEDKSMIKLFKSDIKYLEKILEKRINND